MPSIHPTESPALGWLVPCLNVADLAASLDFYAKLDLVPYGGDVSQGWAMLRNRAIEIHLFQGHIERDVLNFRGGDLAEIRGALEARGLEPRDVTPKSWEVLDPDGRPVFFDTSDEERQAYLAGQPLTAPVEGDVLDGDGLDLGNLTCCLSCPDLSRTRSFYETLGLVLGGGRPEKGWAILARKDHPPVFGTRLVTTSLSLFQGMIPADMLNFRGGDVGRIAATIAERGVDLGKGVVTGEDGGESLYLWDPDGRGVFLDTTPPERLYGA